MPGRDVALLGLGVAGYLDHGVVFPQHGRDWTEAVGRGHEQRPGEVEVQVDMAVPERCARHRSEHLAQRRRAPVVREILRGRTEPPW
ncbi:MAG: hypothetical protein OXH52_06015 [Gammaproteobacteria bacterium]|nr:hypothetical protein [Gammaproteobacteria bacterium]